MEIVSNKYNVVKNSLLNALDIIYKSNDIETIIAAYIGINDFYEDIQLRTELSEVLRKLQKLQKTDKWNLAKESLYNYLNLYEDEIKKNTNYYYNIFIEQTKIISETFSDVNENNNFTPLNDNDIYNILSSYLSKNDTRLLKLFNQYIKNKTMLQINLPFYLGNTAASPIFNNIYVKVRRKNTFEDMLTILHEISHAKIFEDIIKTKNPIDFNKFVCTNPYLEVYPRLQEINFLQFLLDNNILVEDVRKNFVKWLLFFNRLLLKNIELYNKEKKINYGDIRDINSFLYRDLLFFKGTSISENQSMINTIDEQFYLNSFNIDDISKMTMTSTNEIKRLIK